MSLIEQRILISASIDSVWPYVSDPTLLPRWNRAYKQIGVLSTKSTGIGARRRSVGESGKAVVEEVTAWLENLGYEYVTIDGPYQSFRGRFRLQAIPDGTIVSWAVDYQLRGLLAGVRNFLTFRRHQESIMADSLRALRKLVESSGAKLLPDAHARFALQAGPSAESRAARVVPLVGQNGETHDTGVLKPITVNDDDIPEMPAASAAQSTSTADTGTFVSAFANDLSDTAQGAAILEDDTKPRPPINLKDAIAAQVGQGVTDLPKIDNEQPENADSSAHTVPISMVAPPREEESVPDTQTMEFVNPPADTSPKPPKPVQPSQPAKPVKASSPSNVTPPSTPIPKQSPPDSLPERIPTGPMPAVPTPTDNQNGGSDKRSTKDVSIWDVFGVERPSDRVQAELNAVIASIQHRASENPNSTEAQSTEPVQPYAQMSVPASTNGKTANRKATPPVRPLHRRPVHRKTEAPVRPARPGK